MEVGDLTYFPDGSVGAKAYQVPGKKYKSPKTFLDALMSEDAKREVISTDDLDVLWLRYNPAEELGSREWAKDAGIVFGQIAVDRGVLVVNHPDTLSYAINKMYFQHFPESVRPKTLITRDPNEVAKFWEENNKQIVLKPLMGSGGTDVFLMKENAANLRQTVEAINRSGFVIVQEYLPAAKEGDTRLILMNGKPLEYKGKYASIRRVNEKDIRSNISAGGKAVEANITDEILEIAQKMGPKFVQDGLFYAGIDIVGDKVMEINAISAGNLQSASVLEGVDFAEPVIDALERKVYYKRVYGTQLSNKELATMD